MLHFSEIHHQKRSCGHLLTINWQDVTKKNKVCLAQAQAWQQWTDLDRRWSTVPAHPVIVEHFRLKGTILIQFAEGAYTRDSRRSSCSLPSLKYSKWSEWTFSSRTRFCSPKSFLTAPTRETQFFGQERNGSRREDPALSLSSSRPAPPASLLLAAPRCRHSVLTLELKMF